jgi:hypothetical protein
MGKKITRLSIGAIALGCIAFFIMGMSPADMKHWGFPNTGLCGKVGTFHGEAADMGFTWMVVNTPGQNAANGQFTVEWIEIDPTLVGNFPDATRMTNAYGVWKKVGWNVYKYTWIAYGLDQDGFLVYSVRASGTAKLTNCNHADLNYVLEIWPAGLDIYEDESPIPPIPGSGVETRMPLVQATCELPPE